MIIGNGLIARSFQQSSISNCLFFCSGVSDSNEVRAKAFLREQNLLNDSIIQANVKNLDFVYFSSVAAPTTSTKYFNHKIRMENFIKENSSRYFILRLPQVAGPVLNTTLLPTMVENIYKHKHFNVFKYAKRTIVDVEDIVKLFDKIYRNCDANKTINICPGYSFYPEELVHIISNFLDIKPTYDLLEYGSEQPCLLDDSFESEVVRKFYNTNQQDYLKQIIYKYTPQIIKLLNSN